MQNLPEHNPQFFRQPLLKGKVKIRYVLLAGLWLATVAFFWHWWLQPEHVTAWYLYAPVTLCVAWLFFIQAYFLNLFLRSHHTTGTLAQLGPCRVAMVVTKAPAEPFAVVKTTLKAMLAQIVAHDTWLADEDPNPETLEWCRAHDVHVSTRKGVAAYHNKSWPRRTRCKEGNLAYFYDHYGYERYDIVSQLDADHVPEPTYLHEMLRPFADPDIGYVTAPSICSRNASQSWAARSRLHTEAVFHGVVQAGYANGWAPMCIGSHYAVRTKALRAVGGLGPELAEDHSTSMILNAGGWKGMHAIDAIAMGEGPSTVADLIVQEFQWSRSLMTILLQHTPRYFAGLSAGRRLQFVFCQLWYPLLAGFMALMFMLPIAALVFDVRYANITFPAFLVHVWPSIVVMITLVLCMRADGFFRPHDAKVLGWEKMLFALVQWPWVILGSLMAVRDTLTESFVDFRVTPKGQQDVPMLGWRVLSPYLILALFSLLPVLLIERAEEAAGFYIFALVNGTLYTTVFVVIVVKHLSENQLGAAVWKPRAVAQFTCVGLSAACIVIAAGERGHAGLVALTETRSAVRIFTPTYVVTGAGQGGQGSPYVMVYNPRWWSQMLNAVPLKGGKK